MRVAEILAGRHSVVSKCELGERRADGVELEEFARLYRRPLGFFVRGARR